MNYGLIVPKIETREEGAEHVLGSAELPGVIINQSGDWLSSIPDREPQSRYGVETRACAVFNTLSALEALVFFKTGIKVNYSDRYVANVAKNRGILNPDSGSDPHQIAELIRTITGNLREERAPWTADLTTVDKYYGIIGQELANLMLEGTAWYKEWKLQHAWVFLGGTPQQKREKIQEALTKGPVCVSLSAWFKKDGLYYKPIGSGDNHWTMIAQANGDSPYKAFDSYDMYVKDLDPLFDFAIAKVYYLTPVKSTHLFLKNLGFQMIDPEVADLQKALVSLGYPIPHAVSELYGTETRAAVWRFQMAHGIVDNGEHFGPRTRQALNTALNPDAPFGGSFLTYLQAFFSGV